ncbi:DNA gyrase subunit A [Babesia caballi]|uniref:DNA gyrase subunit A n=1 Tax=Babesia caballi TaxID=5871 RepID=A0AAV4LTD6_BABCB|nr:DNA gyrase subunit A [Babesia caballi]
MVGWGQRDASRFRIPTQMSCGGAVGCAMGFRRHAKFTPTRKAESLHKAVLVPVEHDLGVVVSGLVVLDSPDVRQHVLVGADDALLYIAVAVALHELQHLLGALHLKVVAVAHQAAKKNQRFLLGLLDLLIVVQVVVLEAPLANVRRWRRQAVGPLPHALPHVLDRHLGLLALLHDHQLRHVGGLEKQVAVERLVRLQVAGQLHQDADELQRHAAHTHDEFAVVVPAGGLDRNPHILAGAAAVSDYLGDLRREADDAVLVSRPQVAKVARCTAVRILQTLRTVPLTLRRLVEEQVLANFVRAEDAVPRQQLALYGIVEAPRLRSAGRPTALAFRRPVGGEGAGGVGRAGRGGVVVGVFLSRSRGRHRSIRGGEAARGVTLPVGDAADDGTLVLRHHDPP